MNVLITGAGGQLGRTFRDVAAGGPHKCFFTDLREGEGIESLDVTDFDAVMSYLEACSAEVIVNCAAYTNVDGAESDEAAARVVNVEAPKVLAEAARLKGATLVHISTDYVFDGKSCRPYTEEDAPAPASVYGRTKYEGEAAVVASGCKYMIFRTAWLYSRYGRNFFLTMADKTAEHPTLKVVADQVGTPTYALDLAQAILVILKDYAHFVISTEHQRVEKSVYDNSGIYHYSNEGVCSWYDFTKMIAEYNGTTSCDIQPCHSNEFPSPVTRPSYSVLDKTKIKETFGVKVPYWTDSLKKCIANLKKI